MFFILALGLSSAFATFATPHSLEIPVATKSGISEEAFNAICLRIEEIYAPVALQNGALSLEVVRLWSSAEVNANARRMGPHWKAMMHGGLARHPLMTEDAFTLATCHEIGHHLGGFPKRPIRRGGDMWASGEGQSDYWANLKCLRRVWESEDNVAQIQHMEVPPSLRLACEQAWPQGNEAALCIRAGLAAQTVGNLFATLLRKPLPQFDTPDPKVISKTTDAHPAPQCRLDTLFQASRCEVDHAVSVTMDETVGVCHGRLGHTVGLRPRCWFKPIP